MPRAPSTWPMIVSGNPMLLQQRGQQHHWGKIQHPVDPNQDKTQRKAFHIEDDVLTPSRT
jgi:hypothetical protein